MNTKFSQALAPFGRLSSLAASLALIGALPLQAGTLTFQDGFESGNLSLWKQQKCETWSINVVQQGQMGAPAPRSGTHMVRFESRTTDREPTPCTTTGKLRAEIYVTGTLSATGHNWMGWSQYFQAPWDPNSDQIVMQVHGGDCSGPRPVLVFNPHDTVWAAYYRKGCTATSANISPALQTNTWINWVVYYHPSTGSDGVIKIWKDGTLIKTVTGANRPATFSPYYKTGMYTAHDNTLVSYVDNVKHAQGSAGEDLYSMVDPSGGDDTTPPTVSMTAPAAGATVSGTAVTVSANASDNVGVAGVQFKLDGANLGAEDTSSPYSISWNTTTTTNGSHTLTAVARDAAGNTTTSSGITVTVSNPPQAPSNLTATAISSSQINLAWNDVASETGYRVKRSTTSGGPYSQVGGDLAAGTTTFNDTGLSAGTTYYYVVTAFNAAGESGNSNTANATTSADSSSSEFTIPGTSVTASAHDGNVPANTVDGDLGTRWSAEGDGQWIRYDLGATKSVHLTKIAWHQGDARVSTFDVQVSSDGTNWTTVLANQQSSGTTLQLETYEFADTDGRYVRIVGHGNSVNTWNSITEVEVWGSDISEFTIPGTSVTASADDGNVPANTVDGDLGTRWSAEGDGQWIRYDLGATKSVHLIKIAWHQGDARVSTFDVQVSSDGTNWTTLLANQQSSGTTLQLETYEFADTDGRYVRIVGHGNSVNTWNSITETEVWGF